MEYKVKLKDGTIGLINYVCFGFLKHIDTFSWDSYWKTKIRVPHGDGEWRPCTQDEYNKFKDVSNFESVVYHPLNKVPDHVKSALEHPLFENFTVNDDGHVEFKLIDRKIDEVMALAILLRNAIDSTKGVVGKRMQDALKLNDYQRTIIDSAFYTWNHFDGGEIISMNNDDNDVLSNVRVGDFKSLLEGKTPEWRLPQWGELPSGYPRYDWFNKRTEPYTKLRPTMMSCFIYPVQYDSKLNRLLALSMEGESRNMDFFENFLLDVLTS